MATQAQILANRRNARKSTGPRTRHGKALASQNALKHGLSASRSLIASESHAEYDLHSRLILDELNPISPVESILADRVISLSWRLNLMRNLNLFAPADDEKTPYAAIPAKKL